MQAVTNYDYHDRHHYDKEHATPQALCLLEIDNPVDNIEDYKEGRETLQEEVVNSVNIGLLNLSF